MSTFVMKDVISALNVICSQCDNAESMGEQGGGGVPAISSLVFCSGLVLHRSSVSCKMCIFLHLILLFRKMKCKRSQPL